MALVVAVVVLAVVFDFFNGFNDAANVVASMISSRALSPRAAFLIAATCEFLGPLLFGTAVARTIGRGIVDPATLHDGGVVAAGLVGAIGWQCATWRLGLPSSSSHALVGGLVGSAAAGLGLSHVNWSGLTKIVAVLVGTPLVAFAGGWIALRTLLLAASRSGPGVNSVFKRSQILSAIALALSHGANDAQKSMGIITMVLVSAGLLPEFVVPRWVVFACAFAIALGTATGGWSVVRTVGTGIYRLRPVHGLATQISSAGVIFTAAVLGGPVSTSHVVSSSIMGIGSAERIKAVRWCKAREIAAAWILTIPAAALLGAAAAAVLRLAQGAA